MPIIPLVQVLVVLLVLVLLWWAFTSVAKAFSAPQPILVVVNVLFVVIAVLYLLGALGLWPSPGLLRHP